MKNRRILTSMALSGLLVNGLTAEPFNMLIPDTIKNYNKTGLWFAHGTADFRNAFSNDYRNGGFDGFFIYKEKENGFALGDNYSTINALKIYLRPTLLEDITEKDKPTGDAGGVASKEYNSMRIDNNTRTGYVSLGRYRKDWHHPVNEQNPTLWVEEGHTLVLGSVDKYSDGITINYKRTHTPQDWATGAITLDTIAKFEIKGNLVANIKTEHQDGPATNTTDVGGFESEESPYKRVPLVTWGNVSGTISSTMIFDTVSAPITMPKFEYEYNEAVNYYSVNYKRKDHIMNRWVITGKFASRKGVNPLRFISKDHSSTYLEFGGEYVGGEGLSIASEGTILDNEKRRTATFVNALNNVEIGEVYSLKQGSIYMDLEKGAKIHKLGFGEYFDGNKFETGYGHQGGLISMNVKGGTVSIGEVVTDKGYFYTGRNIAMFDASGIRGGVTFDIKTEMENANWLFSVGKDTKIKLGGQYNYISSLKENGGVSMLHKAQNVHIEIDRNQSKQSLIWIGDRELENKKIDTLIGLKNKVVDGGLTIETNINKLSDGKYTPDLVVIRNMLINRNPETTNTINLIARTRAENNFTDHIGKVVGYTTNGRYGTVDFTKVTTWKPTDGILKGYFEIELEGKNYGYDNQYKEWKIKRYDYKGDTLPPPEPEKPDPEPEKPKPDESFGGFDPEPDIGFDPGLEEGPVEKPEPPKPDPDPEKPDPNPNPNPDPNPPVDPDKPIDPPKPPEGGDNGGTKPPVDPTPPDNGGNEKPEEKPEVPSNGPFTETFVRSMEKSTQSMKNLYLATFNSMNKRLGELRGSDTEHGVWGRVFAGAYNDDIFWTLQTGYDNQVLATKDFRLYVGGAVSYAKDEYTDLGEFVGYASLVQNYEGMFSGFYNDALLKVSLMNSKTELQKLMHYGFTVSDEVGYRFRFGEFFVDPQIELSLGYLTGGNYDSLYNGSQVNVNFGDTVHFRARYGVAAGYDYVHKDKIKVQAYLGLFGESDQFTKATGSGSTLGAYGMRQEFAGMYTSDNRMVVNIGTNVDMIDSGKIYFDFEKSFLGDFNIDWKVNIGFRYGFGEKVKISSSNPIKEKVEEKKEKGESAPLALKSEKAKANKTEKVATDVKKASKPSKKVAKTKTSTKKKASVKTAKKESVGNNKLSKK